MSLNTLDPDRLRLIQQGTLSAEAVADAPAHELLRQIIVELKILNMHLTTITEENVTEDDINGEYY